MEILETTKKQFRLAKILSVIIGCMVVLISILFLFGKSTDVYNRVIAVEKMKSFISLIVAYIMVYFVMVRNRFIAKLRALERALNLACHTELKNIPVVSGHIRYGHFWKDDDGEIHYLKEVH